MTPGFSPCIGLILGRKGTYPGSGYSAIFHGCGAILSLWHLHFTYLFVVHSTETQNIPKYGCVARNYPGPQNYLLVTEFARHPQKVDTVISYSFNLISEKYIRMIYFVEQANISEKWFRIYIGMIRWISMTNDAPNCILSMLLYDQIALTYDPWRLYLKLN